MHGTEKGKNCTSYETKRRNLGGVIYIELYIELYMEEVYYGRGTL